MGVVNTYLERNGVDFPLGNTVGTSFRSSSSSFSRGASYNIPSYTKLVYNTVFQNFVVSTVSSDSSSSSSSKSGGTWYTLLSTDAYTSSTAAAANGGGSGSSTVSTLIVNNSAFSSQESSISYGRDSTIETTISTPAQYASFSDLKPTVISVSKSLFLKESPYWWSVGKTETTTTTNQYTTTKNTAESTYTRKTQDTNGVTSEYTYPIIGSVAGSAITKNKLPNIIVGGTEDVYSYQIFSAKGEANVEFSNAYTSLEGPVATVTVDYNITKDDVKVFTITGSDDELPSTSSHKNMFNYGNASSTEEIDGGARTNVAASASYWVNDAFSFDTNASEWVKVPGYWDTDRRIILAIVSSFNHRGTTTRPATIQAAGNSTVPCFSYLEDASATSNEENGFVVFATSYTYKQSGKTKTRYFEPIATTLAGTTPRIYQTTVVSTVQLNTRQVVSITTSFSGSDTSPGFTETYSSSSVTVQGLTAEDYWYDFSVGAPINLFYQGGAQQLPLEAYYKHLPNGFLGFIGSYSDAKTLTAYRNIKVDTSGQPFGTASLDIYDLTELFFEARSGGTVFYPKFYKTFRDFTVVGTGVDGSLQTSAELSVIYSRTAVTNQKRTTTKNSFYSSTGITKTRNNTNVSVGTTTQLKNYKQRTTTNTTRNIVQLTTVTYGLKLDDPVKTTGFNRINFNQVADLTFVKGVQSPRNLNRFYFSRGILGHLNGLDDTTLYIAPCSLEYTMYNSTGGTTSSKTVYTNVSKEQTFKLSKSHIMHVDVKALFTTYKEYDDSANIFAGKFFGLTTSVDGFTFL